MDKLTFERTSVYFLKIVKYMLFSQKERPIKPQDVFWKDVFTLADSHLLSTLVWDFIKNGQEEVESELAAKWKKKYDIAVYSDVAQHVALDEIKRACAEQQIRILPFKGLRFKALYPSTYQRPMADLDVLYEEKDYEKIVSALEKLGYQYAGGTKKTHHIEYFRPPVMHVEIHWGMLPHTSEFYDYFIKPWELARPTEEPYVYEFTLEDEYLFMLVHAYKHYFYAGCGVRTITDFILFRNKYLSQMDADVLEKKLAFADELSQERGASGNEIRQFERTMLTVAEEWFGGEEAIFGDAGLYMLSSGVYGRYERVVQYSINEYGKFRYLMRKVFPSYNFMIQRNPSLKKVPFLLPFYWIGRLFSIVFSKKKSIRKEMTLIQKANKNKEKKK